MKELLLDIKEKLEKLDELYDECEIRDFEREIDKKLKVIEYKEKYDIDLKTRDFSSPDWICIDRYKGNIYIGKGIELFNSDVHPNENETLMVFEYPTGAYTFGTDYNEEVFKKFFKELKKYNFKYIDPINHSLYFELKEGGKLLKEYDTICKKYQELHDKIAMERKKEELKEQLAYLESKLESKGAE